MLYTAGLIASHLQLLFVVVVVVVLTNHNKPRWLTCDPAWRACGGYITILEPLLFRKDSSSPGMTEHKFITPSRMHL